MSEIKYITVGSPSLTIKLAGKRWTAKNGVLDLSPEAAAELDTLMKKRPSVQAQIRKVDMAAAAVRAKEHLAKQPKAAIRGVVTSGTQAAAVLRDAKQANENVELTGLVNPVNVSQKPNQGQPLEVTTVNPNPPKGASNLLGRLSDK